MAPRKKNALRPFKILADLPFGGFRGAIIKMVRAKKRPRFVTSETIQRYLADFPVFFQPNPALAVVKCRICGTDGPISAKKYVIKRHLESPGHLDRARVAARQHTVSAMMTAQGSQLEAFGIILCAILRAGVSYRSASSVFSPEVMAACRFATSIPSSTTLRRLAISHLLPKERVAVKEFVGDDPYSIVADETSLPHCDDDQNETK